MSTSRHSVYVDPGDDMPLDRPSLSAPPPETTERLLDFCAEWAGEMGWELTPDVAAADGVVVGPGVVPPHTAAEVVFVDRAQGIDGFRWAIRHLAHRRQWPYETVTYGLIADQEMDVRRPRRTRRGVAVLLHGGFWMEAWRRDLMEGIAVDLAQQGWESYNVEYGRAGGTGGWPQTGEDVLTAIDAVMTGAQVDHVTVIGHSAGAQLGLWAAAQRPTVSTVLSLAGVCDLEHALQLRLGGGAVERFLAGESPAAATPVEHVTRTARVVLAHCETDWVVPVEQSRRYVVAAEAAGVTVETLFLPEGDHMSLIDPAQLWPVARRALAAASDGHQL